MMQLRPYQSQAVVDVYAHLDERPILCMATGSGKTVTAVEIINRFPGRVLFLAHRRELIAQTAQHLVKYGLSCGIIQAGSREQRSLRVQVASVQTLARRNIPAADLVIIDEAHHVRAGTYLKILEELPLAQRLGLTATPARLDGRGLGAVFGKIIVGATTRELCNDGTLIAPVVYAPPAESMAGVRITRGDFDMEQAARRHDKPKIIGSIIDTWLKHGINRRTIVFAINVAHSRHIVDRFIEAGASAEHLDGETPAIERVRALNRWRSGRTTIISNCGLFNEGFDLPALEVAVIARPTASLVWHLQSIGRVMRAAEGKDGATVLDHAGNTHMHGMVTDDREWTLDDRPKKPAPTEPPCKTCPECYLVCSARCNECPECGYVFTVETTVVREAPGELVRQESFWEDVARRAKSMHEAVERGSTDRVGEFRALLGVASRRGFKPGWAAFVFKSKYGRFPSAQERQHAGR